MATQVAADLQSVRLTIILMLFMILPFNIFYEHPEVAPQFGHL